MMKLLENIKLLRELSEDSFILLDGKSPKHKYSEPKTSDVMLSDEKDIGIMVKGNYVVLDFDDKMSYLKICYLEININVIITNNYFTQQAEILAKDYDMVSLYDRKQLLYMRDQAVQN